MSEIAGGADAVLSLRLEVANTEQLATLEARIKALSKIEPGQVVDPKAKGEIEALSNSVAQFKNKIAQLEGENRTLAASLSKADASISSLHERLKGLGGSSGFKGLGASIQGVDKSLKSITLTSAEASRTLSNYTVAVGKQFESISTAARATSSSVKNAMAAMTADHSGASGLREYYALLEKVTSATDRVRLSAERSHSAMAQARQQAVAGLTAENAEIAKLRAHYAALESQGVRSAAQATVKQFESISTAARATSSSVKNAMAAMTADHSGASGLREYYKDLERTGGATSAVTKSTAAAAKGMHGFSAAQWEAHAAARGLAGSLGALWVTYGSLVPLLTGAAIGSALKSMVQTGAEVEYQLAMIEAVGEGAKVSMTELAAATQGSVFSFGEATNALRVLVQAGQSSADALRTLPTVLKLATIGEVELGKGALTVAAMLETFNLSAGEASRVTNAMAAAAASSPTSVDAMMEAMKQASSMSSQYSVSLEETSAALAVLAKRGIEGTAAGTAFRNLVKELAAPATDKAAKSLEAMGISMFDANGNIKPLTENLQQLADVAKLMSQEDRIKWFESFTNERAAKALDALVMDMEGFRKVTEEVTLAQQGLGFVTEANAKLMTSVSGQWQQLGADMQRVFAGVYESMQPALLNLTMTLREVVASEGFKSALAGLANSFVTLTNFVLENGKAIGTFLALLAGHSVIMTFASVLKTAGIAAAGLATALGTLRTATAAFVAANAAAGVATGTFAATLGGLGTLLSGPVGWALAAAGVAIGAVALNMNRSEDASDDLADSIQKTGNIFTILEDAARRGSEEIGKETEMIRAQIQALKDGTTAAYEFSKASSWKAMVEAQQGFTSNDLQLTQRREAFHSKYGVMPEQASSARLDSYMRREAEKDAKALVELGKQHAATYKRMVDTEEQYRNALEQGAERGALAAELESSKRVAALESQRQAFIAAGAEASKALESGLNFSPEKTKALEEAIERGAKAAQIALPTMEAYSAGAAEAVGQLVQAETALNALRIKPPEIESPFKKLTDAARTSLEAARTAIQDFKNAYADVLSGIKDGTDRLEIGPLEAYERSMAAAAAAYEDMFAAIARAKNTPGLTSSALQKLLTDENKLTGEKNKEFRRLLDERNAALEARNTHLEDLEISVGKKVLSAAEAWLREYQGKYGKTVAALQADITHAEEALAEAIEKGAAPAEIDALRKSLAALRAESARFDASKDLGAWAASVKEAMEQAEKSISTMLEALEEFGARSEKKGFLGILEGDASTFSRMNNANILELRETIAELQRELERAVPGSDLEIKLRAKIYDFESSLRKAEETVHPTLKRWGDSMGDYIAQGIVYGFEEGEDPLKRFAKTLQSEVAKALSNQLSSMFKFSLNRVFSSPSPSAGSSYGSPAGSPSAGSSYGSLADWSTMGTSLTGNIYQGGTYAYNAGFETLGDGMFSLADGVYSLDSTLKTVPGLEGGIGSAMGYGGAVYALSNEQYGTALGTAIGTYITPGIGTMVGSMVGGLFDGMFGGGTPHAGAVVLSDGETATATRSHEEVRSYYANPDDAQQFMESDFTKRYQQGVADALTPVATGLATLYNSTLSNFGLGDGYTVGLGFSADNDDASRGRFSIIDESGAEVDDFIKKFDSDPEAGMVGFIDASAAAIRDALVAADLPGWVDTLLTDLGDAPGIDALNAAIGQVDQIRGLADALSDAVALPGEAMARAAEDLAGQFAALGVAVPTTNADLGALVAALDTTSEEGARTYLALMNLAPAFVELQAEQTALYDQLYTDEQRAANLAQELGDAFADLAVSAPATRDEMRALIDAQDASTDAGARMKAQLLGLVPAFVEVTDAAAEAAEEAARAAEEAAEAAARAAEDAIQSATDAYNRARSEWEAGVDTARSELLTAYRSEADELEATAERMRGFAQSLREAREEMLLGPDSPLSGQQQYAEALRAFSATSALANTGDEDALGALGGSASTYLSAALDQAGSAEDYARDVARAQAALLTAELSAGSKATVADQQLAALREQVSALIDIDDGVISVQEAIANLQLAMQEALTAQTEAMRSLIVSSVQANETLLGRDGAIAMAIATSFSAIDTSLDGLLDDAELRAALVDTGLLTNDQFVELFGVLDSNHDGLISAVEAQTHAFGTSLSVEFDKIDLDKNLRIDLTEFRGEFAGMASDAELEAIFALLDADGDRSISLLESIQGSTAATPLAIAGLGSVLSALAEGTITSADAGKAIADLATIPGVSADGSIATNAWTTLNTSSGTADVWVDPSGAVGTKGNDGAVTVHTKDGNKYSASEVVDYVSSKVASGDEKAVYAEAIKSGISAASLDALMGWSAGTANAWAVENGLAKFATGGAFTNGVVSRPTAFDVGVMGEAGPEAIMPLANIGGSLGVRAQMPGQEALLAEVRALRAEVAHMRAASEATARSTGRLDKNIDRVTEGGRAMQTEAYA